MVSYFVANDNPSMPLNDCLIEYFVQVHWEDILKQELTINKLALGHEWVLSVLVAGTATCVCGWKKDVHETLEYETKRQFGQSRRIDFDLRRVFADRWIYAKLQIPTGILRIPDYSGNYWPSDQNHVLKFLIF